ncbi:sporulation protein YqfD [Halobacillus rhizosphaerae]|uniref:sporulation protein YqfD n=1 Tax=Halobacillus rhizosphaerae TaxID=3064889 RepID=UPI00398A6D6A
MSSSQQDYFFGIVTISVKGKLIEPFLQACVRNGCQISNVTRVSTDEVQMSIRLKDRAIYRRLRKSYRCKIHVVDRKGIPFLFQKMLKRTSLVLAFLIAVILVFLLANTLWSIKVDGLTPELEASVEKQLKSYGVSPGKLTIGMKDPIEIQSKLLEDVPDLLWIGVKKQGTSYHLYGVEKTRQDINNNNHPADLVASKKGMVIKTFIKKGKPLVAVNEIVKKGQKLAAGELAEDSDTFVRAEGEVVAETWYKASLTVPMKQSLMLTNGDTRKAFNLKFGRVEVPMWGWWHKKGQDEREEHFVSDWKLFKWDVPVNLATTYYIHNESQSADFSKEEAIKRGMNTAKQTLYQQLSKDAEVKEENVLHERKENGKVKLILLFKVYENIAVTRNH